MLLTKSRYDLQRGSVIIHHGGSELSPTLPCPLHKEWPKHLPRKKRFFLIGGKLLCNGVLDSALQQQHESGITIHMSPPSHSSFPPPSHLSRLSQNMRLDDLCYTATFQPSVILHMIVYVCRCYFLNLAHPHFPPLCPRLFSTRFVSPIYLYSIYMH